MPERIGHIVAEFTRAWILHIFAESMPAWFGIPWPKPCQHAFDIFVPRPCRMDLACFTESMPAWIWNDGVDSMLHGFDIFLPNGCQHGFCIVLSLYIAFCCELTLHCSWLAMPPRQLQFSTQSRGSKMGPKLSPLILKDQHSAPIIPGTAYPGSCEPVH